MLESAIKIDHLVELVKKRGMDAVCLSDRGNLFAPLEFSLAASKASVQPIHGSILNILFTNKGKEDFAEILLIAKDEVGYQNLLKLVSFTFTKNDRKICNHINFGDLEKYGEGLVVLSGYTEGVVGKFLLESSNDAALNAAKKLQNLFGDRFYFEIMRHGKSAEQKIEPEYLKIARELKIPLIATNQVLFGDISMHDAHDVLLCISGGVVREVQDRKRVSNQCYFKSPEEMITLFQDLPEAIENTVCLAKRCYVMSETRPPSLPNFTDGSISEDELIRTQAKDGLDSKLASIFKKENIKKKDQTAIIKEYNDRLDYELNVICNMGFPGYFLIVSDFIKWSTLPFVRIIYILFFIKKFNIIHYNQFFKIIKIKILYKEAPQTSLSKLFNPQQANFKLVLNPYPCSDLPLISSILDLKFGVAESSAKEIFHILNHSLSCSESCMDKACNEMKNAILHRIEHSRTEDNSDQTVCLSKCLRIIFIHIQMLLTTFTLFTL